MNPAATPTPETQVSYFLSSLELWQLALIVVVLPTAAAMAAQPSSGNGSALTSWPRTMRSPGSNSRPWA
jgi:hypothetical protein